MFEIDITVKDTHIHSYLSMVLFIVFPNFWLAMLVA